VAAPQAESKMVKRAKSVNKVRVFIVFLQFHGWVHLQDTTWVDKRLDRRLTGD
jgi:hypothetical protein